MCLSGEGRRWGWGGGWGNKITPSFSDLLVVEDNILNEKSMTKENQMKKKLRKPKIVIYISNDCAPEARSVRKACGRF